MMLSLLWLLPLVGAALTAIPAVSGRDVRRARPIALGFALATLVVAIVIAIRFDPGAGMQLTETHDWISVIGAHYAVGVDGLGLLMVLLTAALVPIVLIAAWAREWDGDRASYLSWVLALEALGLLVFLATDVFLFYVVFEATLIPAYFMVGGWGGTRRAAAALKFLMYQLGGGLVLLASVVGLWVVSSRAGEASYLLSDLQRLDLATGVERWLFVGFFVAFAVKAPLFPVHTWLADTTGQATPPTSVLLVCVLDKIGTFGMLRFCLGLFPEASQWATPVVVVLALVSIVYGAFLAIGQDDLLRLIGLTSLSHFGFIVLGIFVFTDQGGSGAILYMVNHGVATAALFLVAGFVIQRRGTSSIAALRAAGGLERATPVLAGLFLVAGLATAGLPGLSQFVSEILVLISAFDHHPAVAAVAVTGIVLAAIYVLWAYQRIFTGGAPAEPTPLEQTSLEPVEPVETSHSPLEPVGTAPRRDATRRELTALVPLTLALVFFGFVPGPLLAAADPVVHDLLQHAGVHDDGPAVPAAGEGH